MTRLTSANAPAIIAGYDIVLDGTDNFPARYLINDACVLAGKTLVHGAFLRFGGQVLVIRPREGACFRCLFPEPPPPGSVPSCSQAGVLGALAGVVSMIMTTEALKLILGIGVPLTGSLLVFDALEMRFRTVRVPRAPDCPVCGDAPTVTGLVDYELFCGLRCRTAPAGEVA